MSYLDTLCWNSRFWSAVRKASNSVLASWRSSPFDFEAQPRPGTVATSCPGRWSRRSLGSDSSRRSFIHPGEQEILGELDEGDGLLPLHRGELIEELVG